LNMSHNLFYSPRRKTIMYQKRVVSRMNQGRTLNDATWKQIDVNT